MPPVLPDKPARHAGKKLKCKRLGSSEQPRGCSAFAHSHNGNRCPPMEFFLTSVCAMCMLACHVLRSIKLPHTLRIQRHSSRNVRVRCDCVRYRTYWRCRTGLRVDTTDVTVRISANRWHRGRARKAKPKALIRLAHRGRRVCREARSSHTGLN